MTLLPATALLLLSLPDAAATEPRQPLPPVVVTATRQAEDPLTVPAAVDLLTDEDIGRARPRANLSEALQQLPGVVARDRQNQAQDQQISIRGFGARASFGVRGVRIYSDGIPATMPDGQGQVSHLVLPAAGRIEVLRGPFSALYGNAAGGVIDVTTATAPDPAEASGGLALGDFGLRHATAGWRSQWGATGQGDALVDLGQIRSDGFRRHSRSRRDQAQVLVRGGLGGQGEWTVLANHMDLSALDPQGLTRAELDGDRRAASPGAGLFDTRKTVRQDQAGARLGQPLGEAGTLTVTAWAGRRQTFQVLSVPVAAQANPLSGGGVIDLDRDYHGLDLRWRRQGLWLGRDASLTVGVQHEQAEERRLGFENFRGETLGVVGALRRDEDNRVRGRDAYAQADLWLAPRWRLAVGARHSAIDFDSRDRYVTAANPDDSGGQDYRRLTPVAGLLYRASDSLSLYGNLGGGFETPTLAELAYRGDGSSGLNTALRPARSRHGELGARWRSARVQASAALFRSDTRDELVVLTSQGGRTVFTNAGLSRRQGAELAFSAELSGQWSLAGSWTLMDARHRRDAPACDEPPCPSPLIAAGRRIPGLAGHDTGLELSWRPVTGLEALLEARRTGRVAVNDANSAFAPSATTVDFAIQHRGGTATLAWRSWLRLANLGDRDVVGSVIVNEANARYFEPAPGRHWQLGIELTRRF
ncbi:MAG: TonB-dependent receptor [Xanthomonadales bacterium]|nr:TonB-dependent receptor [Xanthomonadales bacterium]